MKKKESEIIQNLPKKPKYEYRSLFIDKCRLDDNYKLKYDWEGQPGFGYKNTYIKLGFCTEGEAFQYDSNFINIDSALNYISNFGWRLISIYTTVKSEFGTSSYRVETDQVVYTFERKIE